MRQEIKNDVTIKHVIGPWPNCPGFVKVEMSTGQIGKCKWDYVNNRPGGPVDIIYNEQRPTQKWSKPR